MVVNYKDPRFCRKNQRHLSGPKTQEYYHKSVQERIKQGQYTGPDLSALTQEDSDDDLEMTLKWLAQSISKYMLPNFKL